jgi:hypothetical protein
MRLIVVALLAALCLLAIGCGKKKAPPPLPAATQEGPFAPTPDSTLTALQVERWLKCNTALDSLSFAYQDSFKVEDPAKKVQYERAFISAQNAACLTSGLRGGYEEYRWVSGALANPRNKALRDSFDLPVYE